MTDIFNGKMKYLFLVPIMMIILFAWLNRTEIARLRNELFELAKVERQSEIDLIANMIDKENELGMDFRKSDYEILLSDYLANLSISRNVFTGLYDSRLNLIADNKIKVDGKDFDPLLQDNFFIVTIRESGWITSNLFSENGQTSEAPIHMYYRWVPNTSLSDDNFLMVVGVSHDSIAIDPGRLLTMGMIIQMVVTFIINMIFVLLLCYLGKIYRSRKGEKWRAEL